MLHYYTMTAGPYESESLRQWLTREKSNTRQDKDGSFIRYTITEREVSSTDMADRERPKYTYANIYVNTCVPWDLRVPHMIITK